MVSSGYFTGSDRSTIKRAGALAETLMESYFNLPKEEWTRRPYGVLTRKEVGKTLYQADVFANVISFSNPKRTDRNDKEPKYGIVLQDPNILRALLRSYQHDLWTLGLFILTHELIHIVRFRRFGVDFFASTHERDREEHVVQGITREVLAGVTNTDYVLGLY